MNDVRFVLLGFPVRVMPGFFVLLGIYALFGLQWGEPLWQIASWWVVVFTSILVHELGHAGTARSLHLGVSGIRLHQFGGDVGHQPGRPFQNLKVSLAGPGAGLAFGLGWLVVGFVAPPSRVLDVVLSQFLFVNIFWSLFNLLPIAPMDGGNALTYALRGFRVRDAERIGAGVGMVTALGLALVAWGAGSTLLAVFGLYFLYHNFQRFQATQTGIW